MVELKDRLEMEGKLQLHSHLMLMEHKFASLKVFSLKVLMQGTYCIVRTWSLWFEPWC